MTNPQLEMWPEEIRKGYRLHQHLLAPGEKPDTRPWGGIFDQTQVCDSNLATQIQEEIDDGEARKRIQQLFTDHPGSLFYDEIAEKLRLPLRQVVEVCNQLEEEGLIGEPSTK